VPAKPAARAPEQARVVPSAATPSASPASHAMLPADEVIEVPAEEMDLASLAELAKKVVERKP
jgi:hypothetical protein